MTTNDMTVIRPDLSKFDIILVNTSAGKDSQAMLHFVCIMAKEQGVLDRVVAVHSDLGRVEWAGTRELAEEQARHYGVRFEVAVTRPKGDLLSQVEFERKKWPGSSARFCTSDHKTSQVKKVLTALVREFQEAHPERTDRVRVLNCLGLRAEESSKRSHEPNWVEEQGLGWSNSTKRAVTRWLPIQDWSLEQVWTTIRLSGVRHHPAYDLGMPRLSCVFCVYASKAALMVAGQHNPELLDEYVRVEEKIGHSFRNKMTIASIRDAIRAGEEVTGEISFGAAM